MLYCGADPESYITEYTLVYEENTHRESCEVRKVLQQDLSADPFHGMASYWPMLGEIT